jgi:hypothetical protein
LKTGKSSAAGDLQHKIDEVLLVVFIDDSCFAADNAAKM